MKKLGNLTGNLFIIILWLGIITGLVIIVIMAVWSEEDDSDNSYHCVWGSSSNDIYVLGSHLERDEYVEGLPGTHTLIYMITLHYDGNLWTGTV